MIREMMAQEQARAAATRVFLRSWHDGRDAIDRQIAARIRERLHSAQYRREREQCSEWVDHGGEG